MATEIQITGIEEIAKKLGLAVERIEEAVCVTVYGQAIALAELINRKGMVPVNTGRLRSSLYITLPTRGGGNAYECTVGYGAPYAGEVHEARGESSGWVRKATSIYANAYQIRAAESLRAAITRGLQVSTLVAAGIPTSPIDPGSVSKYRRKYGFSRDQSRAIQKLSRRGALKLVRRFRTKRTVTRG